MDELSFDEGMKLHHTKWRQAHIAFTEQGLWRGRPYPWYLSKNLWEEGLWIGIRSASDNPLPAYLAHESVQKHEEAHSLKSSWVMCANLYFPCRASPEGRNLLASFLKKHVADEIDSLESMELEYEGEGELHPSPLLGERRGTRGANQTSPDLGLSVNGGRGLVLVESKFTEHHFYRCSALHAKGGRGRPKNPDPDRCNHLATVASDPATQCHQSAWGRKYWQILAPVVNQEVLPALPHCPAARDGFQLFRQQALAEGIAQSGQYDLVVSVVAMDARNDGLNTSLQRSGITELQRWGDIFKGKARFAVFTHQQWVGWVREHDIAGEWADWLEYVDARYGFSA